MKIILVACSSTKLETPAAARELYCSEWFKKARKFAEANGDQWFIISAKHGLIDPTERVAPYNETLNEKSTIARRVWFVRVADQLSARGVDWEIAGSVEFVVLGGFKYAEHFATDLSECGFECALPLQGLGIGEQLSKLNQLNSGAAVSAIEKETKIMQKQITNKTEIENYLKGHEGETVTIIARDEPNNLVGIVARAGSQPALDFGVLVRDQWFSVFTINALLVVPETLKPLDPTIARAAVPANKTIGFLIDELDACVGHIAGQSLFKTEFKNRYSSETFHSDIKKLTADVCKKWGIEFGTWKMRAGADSTEILTYCRPIVEGSETAQKIGKIDSVFFDLSVEGSTMEMTIDEVVRLAAVNDRRKALSNFRSQIAEKAAEIARISQLADQYDEDLTALLTDYKRGDILKLTDGGLETLVEWRIRDFRGGGVDCIAIMNANFSDQDKPFERVFKVAELRTFKAKVVRNEPAKK